MVRYKQSLKLYILILIRVNETRKCADYLCEQIKYIEKIQPYRVRNREDIKIQLPKTIAM